MRNERLQTVSKMERETDCIIRKIFAGLVAVMIIVASVSLLIGQPFVKGFILLMFSVLLAAMTLGYSQIKFFCKAFRLWLKR